VGFYRFPNRSRYRQMQEDLQRADASHHSSQR
jgi:hypothetical protein